MKFLLDNGHGKETPGKRSPVWPDGSQLFEWKFNREIVQGIHSKLTLAGISSEILVPEEYDLPLIDRCLRANCFHSKEYSILVSVHVNATPGAQGWEIWTSKGETTSDLFAEYFCDSAIKYLPDFRMRFERIGKNEGRDKDKNFKILYGTHGPAVLTENLFMDNPDECRYLLSEHGKQSIIDLHVSAIMNIRNDFKDFK